MKAIFEHKPTDFNISDVKVEKVIRLTAGQFEMMLLRPLKDSNMIQDNRELMYRDDNGCLHCLLFMAPGRVDGLLVESEGSNYCRLAAYIPDACTLAYPSLLKHSQQLMQAVDFIVDTGTRNTSQGSWVTSFKELEQSNGLEVEFNSNTINVLGSMLQDREEVLQVETDDESMTVSYHPEYCPQLKQEELAPELETLAEAVTPTPTLWDLLTVTWEDIHLCHQEIDNMPATICELSRDTLTPEGQQAWADVLGAKVHRIYTGCYGMQLELSGVKTSRLDSFSQMLAGYCSAQDYERWVEQEQLEYQQDMTHG